ncbi:ATG12 [Candida theae]|uniref:Ubiquitin-like protein ATG12 n=1 Tax=Candida theae TaxID=1198502 RepID=A0AAD5FW88_9ASCO|nr:ATG12 [Candida theae]KAI5948658.1 ATG12 [Candida theae]
MSHIRHSEPENEDDSSSLSSSSSSNSSLPVKVDATEDIEGQKLEPRIPLSTSIILNKLPVERQEQLERTLEERERKPPLKADIAAKPVADEPLRISIRFQPIGSTTAINPKVFKISSTQTVATLSKFLCKRLKQTHLCLYIQNSFSPAPEENIGDLYSSFKTKDELIVSYCNSVAFG